VPALSEPALPNEREQSSEGGILKLDGGAWLPLALSGLLAACGTSQGDDGVPSHAGGTGPGGASTAVAGTASDGGAGTAAGATGGGRAPTGGGAANHGGAIANGGARAGESGEGTGGGGSGAGGVAGTAGSGGAKSCNGPVGTISGALATGVAFMDTAGEPVNAHGGGIVRVGDTFYMHGELFLKDTTDNLFRGFSMYSSPDLATWKNEGIILPQQSAGELGPNRHGERPHIIQCPSTGEFVLYAHAASSDYQMDKEVVYATSATVNGQYAYKGPLKNASGALIVHSDMSAYADSSGAYVLAESGHLFTLASDCHSWLSDKSMSAVNGTSGGAESPTVFKAGGTYYWIGSNKTGWRANNNFYSTAPAITGPWTYQGFIAPVADTADILSAERTWLSQSTWVQPVTGCAGTVYLYWGDHWDGTQDTTAPGKHNDRATYVFQPLVLGEGKQLLPTYKTTWKLDVGAGTWSE
jgi:hypothetical protein